MKSGVYFKITSALVIPSIIISTFFVPTQKAEAITGCTASVISAYLGKGALAKIVGSVVPVGDSVTQAATGGSFIADCVLPPIAITMARTMARNISNSIVNWINNDFKGKPSFVTNFDDLIRDTGDEVIGRFIYGSDLAFLCQPFSFQIRLALATKYQQPFKDQIRCSVTDITKNTSAFVKNNGGAGWNNWLEITTQPQNNVYGAYLMADSKLAQNISNQLDQVNQALNWGGGFLGWQECVEYDDPKTAQAMINGNLATMNTSPQNTYSGGAFNSSLQPTNTSLTGGTSGTVNNNTLSGATAFSAPSTQQNSLPTFKDTTGNTFGVSKTCKKWKTQTPGGLVEDQAKTVLGGWSEQLNLAQDINQIVGALISHFADKMISGKGGFLGLSSSGGYARSTLNYAQASTLSANESNPDNAGLGEVNNAISTTLSNVFEVSQISGGPNIAEGKSVNESNPGVGSSSWITDGDITSSAATAAVRNPWIEIDLDEPQEIGALHIWTPSNGSVVDSLGTFDIVVSNTSGGRDWVSNQITMTDGAPNPVVVQINKTGRYVRIERFSNSYDCGDSESPETCYRPLEIAELQVVAPGQGAPTTETPNPEDEAPVITVGPVTAPSTIGHTSPFAFAIPINSSKPTKISLLDVRLYAGDTQVAFNSAFSEGRIGKKQNGITNFYFPGGTPGTSFENVPTGGSSETAIFITGTALPPINTSAYKIVITAKGSAGDTLDTRTINFVVQ